MTKRPRVRIPGVSPSDETEDFQAAPQRGGSRKSRSVREIRRAAAAGRQQGEGGAGGERWRKEVTARSGGQEALMEAMASADITLALGPAGTGKTLLAVCAAVAALEAGKVRRIVLTRPAVEAGEKLGFLPGDLREKLDPYMRPLFDAMLGRLPAQRLNALIEDRVVEIAPIAFMRGRTLADCAVIVDEAQNATLGQLKMLATRLGMGSFMVFTGDPDQSDLDEGDSGLSRFAQLVDGADERIAVIPVVKSLVRVFGTA